MPQYSICMCNYNMADTLETALGSILVQLDQRFEVVVVDDGSSDNSLEVLKKIQEKYPNLRVVPMPRDADRKLGFTRNVSIREAQGEYVLLHLDCDDVTAPFIKEFTNAFHQIERAVAKDFLLSGLPIQMGKRDFLLQYGPYRNIHRGEDRDMWSRLAAQDGVLWLQHQNFKTRLPKTQAERIYRAVYYTFDHMRNDFRGDVSLRQFIKYEFTYKDRFSWKIRLLRLLLTLPAWTKAKIEGPLPQEKALENAEQFGAYRRSHIGTLSETLQRYNAKTDWSGFSSDAKTMFSN